MTDIQSLPRDLREVGCCCRGDGHTCVSCLAADEIERLRGEVAAVRSASRSEIERLANRLRSRDLEIDALQAERDALKAAAEKGTEYVLAQINQDLRGEVAAWKKEAEISYGFIDKAKAERDAAVGELTKIKAMSDCETANNFLHLTDEQKKALFALGVIESSRRKKAEDERDAAVKALRFLFDHGAYLTERVPDDLKAAIDAARHQHTDACWEPDSGCDMGRNPDYVAKGEV